MICFIHYDLTNAVRLKAWKFTEKQLRTSFSRDVMRNRNKSECKKKKKKDDDDRDMNTNAAHQLISLYNGFHRHRKATESVSLNVPLLFDSLETMRSNYIPNFVEKNNKAIF